MKKVKKMGTGGLPVGAPEKGGGVKQPPRPGMDIRDAVRNATPTPRPTRPNMDGVRDAVRNVTTQQPTTRPPGKGTTGGPLVKPPPPGMGGLGQAMSNLGIKRNAGTVGGGLGRALGGLGMGMKKGGKVSSASKRADGIASKGKTKGRMI